MAAHGEEEDADVGDGRAAMEAAEAKRVIGKARDGNKDTRTREVCRLQPIRTDLNVYLK